MKTKHLLTAAAAALLLAATTLTAQAERAVIYGTLTIINDQFVLKTDQPFETEIEDWADNDKPMMVSTSKIQLAGYGPEQVPVLRTLVGKKVTAEGEIIPAHTRYHIEPLLISIGDEEEGDIWELNTGLEDKY